MSRGAKRHPAPAPALQAADPRFTVLLNDQRAAVESLLALVLWSPGAIDKARALDPDRIVAPQQRRIYQACLVLRERGERVNPDTVHSELARDGQGIFFSRHQQDGGLAHLNDLQQRAFASLSSRDMDPLIAKILLLDGQIQAARAWSEAATRAVVPGADLSLIDADVQEVVRKVALPAAPVVRFPAAPDRVYSLWSTVRPPRVSTCFPSLNRMTKGGLIRGRNTSLIAPTGRGKTSFAMQQARHFMSDGLPVLYISTELPEEECYSRFLGQILLTHWLEVDGWGPSQAADLRDRATEHLSRLTVVEFDGSMGLTEIMRAYLADKGEVPIVVVDVIQDVATFKMSESRTTDMRAATRAATQECKGIARTHSTVLLLLSHTSRAFSRDRESNRTKAASDFESAGRDSADLEQDSAIVLFLDTDDCPEDGTAEARLHVAKCSGNARQTVGLKYHGRTGLFEDCAAAALPPELREALDAIEAGHNTLADLRKVLEIKQERCTERVRALENRGLVKRTYSGIVSVRSTTNQQGPPDPVLDGSEK